jgi:hypothetical protein
MARRRWDDDDDLVEKLATEGRTLLASRYTRGWRAKFETFGSPGPPLTSDESHRFLASCGALEGYAPTFALSFSEILDVLRRSGTTEMAMWAEPYIVKAWREFNFGDSADRRVAARNFLRDAAALGDEPRQRPRGQPSEIRSETILAWYDHILAKTQRLQKAHRASSQAPTAAMMPVIEVQGSDGNV